MGRIRSIKPEFPISESIGRLARESRLLFILLWTLVDDSGRARGNLAIIRGALYPYDEDVTTDTIAAWMSELVREQLVICYEIEGTKYLQIAKWSQHQKIDRPSPSKFPAFDESSTNARCVLDAGSRILDIGSRNKDINTNTCNDAAGGSDRRKRVFEKPSIEEIQEFADAEGLTLDVGKFWNYYESNGWKVGRNPMRDWRAAARNAVGWHGGPADRAARMEVPQL